MQMREELSRYCGRVYEKGFVSSNDGNLSARLENGNILITPSGRSKGDILPEDLIEIDINGNKIKGTGKVTTEAKIHLLAYKRREDVNAITHCHPVFATAFATIGEGFTAPVFPEVILSLGKVPLCRYGTPSTDELPESMNPFIDFAWAMLLENHGAITFGRTISDSYFKMEKLEHSAKTLYHARMMGREKILPRHKVQKLYEIAEKTYGIKISEMNKFFR